MAKWVKIRRLLLLISVIIFPVTMNYLSPVVSMMGAKDGFVTGAVINFGLMFIFAMLLGRLWCGWACAGAGLGELCMRTNDQPANIKKLDIVKYFVWAIWLGMLIFFLTSAGFKGINYFYKTENIISVDEPFKYIPYFAVVATFFIFSFTAGRRATCHTICWMAPFMIFGKKFGKLLRLPQLGMKSSPEKCVNCHACDKVCPMSLPVTELVHAKNGIDHPECVTCGECAAACRRDAIKMRFRI
jgi:ferredoxin-type protein NapH